MFTIRELREDVKAFFRGERRAAPYGTTGRVYTPRKPAETPAQESQGGHAQASGRATGTLTMQITRANGDVETVVVPATAERV
jgi:hypothetical protein